MRLLGDSGAFLPLPTWAPGEPSKGPGDRRTGDGRRGGGLRDPEDVAKTVRAVIGGGAVGVNLEDGTGEQENPLYPLEAHAERVAAAS